MIEVTNLSKHYDDFAAVSDLSFAVQPGQVLGLVGPNGAGKTTSLRCLAGIIAPTGGEIHIAGHDLRTATVDAKKALAFFSDEPRLFDFLTVRQHLEFTARLYQVAGAGPRSDMLLERLEMTEKANALPGELSRGMKQKVALACGFLHSPRAMLFDEPLTGLDPLAIRRIKDLVRAQAADGVAIVISSHLLHLLEELCTHVLILKRGRSIASGTLDEVRGAFLPETVSLEEVFIRLVGEDAGQ